MLDFCLASDLPKNAARARWYHWDVAGVARKPNKAIAPFHVPLTHKSFSRRCVGTDQLTTGWSGIILRVLEKALG